jgi:thiosulfate dehydrogenase [quinone] large subunit
MSIQPDEKKTQQQAVPAQRSAEPTPEPEFLPTPATTLGRSLAVLRIVTGFVFLWAFADKLFGWGYATPSKGAWLNGGSPTKGFLSGVDAGPFQSLFHAWAGTWWADTLFMLGLLGIGTALIAGIGLRISAIAGSLMTLMMWAAEWPLAKSTSAGAATHSSNPLIDYHIIYALIFIVLAAAAAGDTWGLGRRWADITGERRWLR